jgi:hypothetical protein
MPRALNYLLERPEHSTREFKRLVVLFRHTSELANHGDIIVGPDRYRCHNKWT